MFVVNLLQPKKKNSVSEFTIHCVVSCKTKLNLFNYNYLRVCYHLYTILLSIIFYKLHNTMQCTSLERIIIFIEAVEAQLYIFHSRL